MNGARMQILLSRLIAGACRVACVVAFTIGCGERQPETLQTAVPSKSPLAVLKSTNESPQHAHGVAFEDAAQKLRLTHVWPQQPRPMRTNEAFGCGCAAFDFDDDGWQDILLVANPHPVLYRNSEGTKFVDVTQAMGLNQSTDSTWTGCAVGDYDGDGWLDVLLTGLHRLSFYRNLAGQRFEDVTAPTGLDASNHDHWGATRRRRGP